MHYRKYRLALAFVVAMVIGSAVNLWFIFISSALNQDSTVTFTTNEFHEQNIEFVLLGLFIITCIWLYIRRNVVLRLFRWKLKEDL